MSQIKTKLIYAGVKNLKEFGYPHVNADNILTDEVYSLFFKKMLIDAKGNDDKIDTEIDELISQIKD